MGKKQSKLKGKVVDDGALSKQHFQYLYVVGKGGFGKVWQVRYKKTGGLYALKEMSKARILDKNSAASVNYEVELLSRISHPSKGNLGLL